jgi:hypothetical protein
MDQPDTRTCTHDHKLSAHVQNKGNNIPDLEQNDLDEQQGFQIRKKTGPKMQ